MNIVNKFTLRTLQKNKVRTFVTILGIILATSMFVAITSIIVSLQNYMLDVSIEQTGDWHGHIYGIDEKQTKICEDEGNVSKSSIVEIYKNQGESEAVTFRGIDDKFKSMLSVKLVKGTMPKNSSQIIMTSMAKNVYFKNCKIGDKVKLDVGGKDKEFEVTGFCQQVSGDSMHDMQIYTKKGAAKPETYAVYFKCKNISKTEDTLNGIMQKITKEKKDNADDMEWYTNSSLLKFYGKSSNSNYNKTLYGMGAILMLIIMIASVSLIHNAFSISVSERTKQFGLLKSAGATKKQILRSVFFEAGLLCIIGIPIGIICGIAGIGITLNLLGKQFAVIITSSESVNTLKMHISAVSVIIAIAVTVITVFISALIPALKAVRITVLQALKQNESTELKRKNVKVNPVMAKVFGFEGTLADKNFKRNKRKQRVTIFSIAVSTALFVAVNSFTSYMSASLRMYKNNSKADLSMTIEKDTMDKGFKNVDDALKRFKGVDNIDDCSYSLYDNAVAEIKISDINKEYLEQLKQTDSDKVDEKKGIIRMDAMVYYIEDNAFHDFIKKNNLKNNNTLVWQHLIMYNGDEQKNYSYDVLKSDADIKLYRTKEKKGYSADMVTSYKKLEQSYYADENLNAEDGGDLEFKTYSGKDAFVSQDVKAMRCDMELPLSVDDMSDQNMITIVRPYSEIKNIPSGIIKKNTYKFGLKAKKHAAAQENLYAFTAAKLGSNEVYIYDNTQSKEISNALVLIVNVFSYGFIILISLIVIANVFNTISTNILLRRQAFATLKSVGMTKKGLHKMMNYECAFYGVKGLVFGMIMAVLLTYAMYRVMGNGFNVGFYIPIQSIVVVIASIFAVVFSSMIYTMKKIKKDNVIETLRNENI